MKGVVAAVALVGALAVPGLARAGSSTDAALGLGAFAVFNQILSGTGVFGGGRAVIVERPIVVAPPPPPPVVYYPPPPPVVYAPPPGVIYAPAPRTVGVYPAPPAVVYRVPGIVYAPAPAYGYYAPYDGSGQWRHGRHWKRYHRHDD
jgi:hypothetical protein